MVASTNGGFQFDARSHHLELAFVQLMGERASVKAQLAGLNLKAAQVTRDYAKHNHMSRDEASLMLLRLLKLSASDGPNFYG